MCLLREKYHYKNVDYKIMTYSTYQNNNNVSQVIIIVVVKRQVSGA